MQAVAIGIFTFAWRASFIELYIYIYKPLYSVGRGVYECFILIMFLSSERSRGR